jgi:hypothetical protein
MLCPLALRCGRNPKSIVRLRLNAIELVQVFGNLMKKLMILAVYATTSWIVPTYAATEAQCELMWNDSIMRGEGYLSDAEAMRYVAAMRVRGYHMPADAKISYDVFLEACKANVYSPREAETGAPFQGANSSTEGQAIDLAVAHGFINVLGLTKGDDGIWRGRGGMGGKYYQIAIDFKGNVTSKSAP